MSSPSETYCLIEERYGNTGINNAYIESADTRIIKKSTSSKYITPIKNSNQFRRVLCEAFLPKGFPQSVSNDYFVYQFYDTIQAFASRITGTIATKAILKGVGVGDANATPIAAAITWIFKDGTGMFGAILFAWWKGTDFDGRCKKWRLFADVLNDLAMFLELFLPAFAVFPLPLLCITTCMKAAVGVAGAATRAAITQHQALQGNCADVAAKDGSQETAVNLVASFFAVLLLTLFGDTWFEWVLFAAFILIHLFANTVAVKALLFETFNTERLLLVFQHFFLDATVQTPRHINAKESCFLGFGITSKQLCGYNIKLGASIDEVLAGENLTKSDCLISDPDHFIIIPKPTTKTIYIAFAWSETTLNIIEAYFHAVLLAFILQIKENPNYNSDFSIVQSIKEEILKDPTHTNTICRLNRYIEAHWTAFRTELSRTDWNLEQNSIQMDSWRVKMKQL